MKKFRGFLIKNRVISLFRRIRRRFRSKPGGYRRLNPSNRSISRFLKWGSRIKAKARAICSKKSKAGYLRFREDDQMPETGVAVPKGKMAVYIGQEDEDYERVLVLVPVIYINHPLFVQLLRKTEEVYGHDHRGGITIPCRISEFENVKSTIAAAGSGGRKMLPWKRPG